MNCPLCKSDAPTVFYNRAEHVFYKCNQCDALFRPKEYYLDSTKEHQRYLTHNNDVNDVGYQNFVRPIVTQVVNNFDPAQHRGLDFGAGPGPVITKLLKEKNFNLALYDPYFWPETQVLQTTYDFIVCCEVVEHFNSPAIEFKRLHNLLNKDGQLICKTALYDDSINFEQWYYKNDRTHVIFYTQKTLDWIAKEIGFKRVETTSEVIVFYT